MATKSPVVEIARIDKLIDVNRLILLSPGDADIRKVKARVNELLDERLVWMKAAKRKRPVKEPTP